jgi:O-antigen/teichoic acid export membrane protein
MIRNIIHSLFTRAGIAIINFLILFATARYLGASSRGEISIFLLNIALIQAVNEIYTGYSLIHFIPRNDFRKLVLVGVLFTLAWCLLSNSLLLALHRQVPGYGLEGFIVSVLVMLNTFNCVLILGTERIRIFNFLSFIQPLMLLCGVLSGIFIFRDFTFTAYLNPLIFSFAVAFLLSSAFLVARRNKAAPEKKFTLRPVIVNGVLYQSAILIFILGNRFSFYFLGENASVGLYSVASSLMESVLIISAAITPVLLARVANLQSSGNGAGIALQLAKVSLLCAVSGAALLMLLPGRFFAFLFGEAFSEVKLLMALYMPAVILMAFFLPLCNFFTASGRQKVVLLACIPGFISTMIISPFMVSRFGIWGAAFAADITFAVHALVITFCFIRFNQMSFGMLFSFSLRLSALKQIVDAPGQFPRQ